MKIVLIEPTWDGTAHSPGNLGALRVLRRAFPAAAITLVTGLRHLQELRFISPADIDACVQHLPLVPALDKDTLPGDVLATWQRLSGAPARALKEADLVLMASATATSLSIAVWQGWAHKAVAVLHGNANELGGWRSRNPLRRMLDLHAALRRFVARGGKVNVYEARILEALSQQHPWLSPALMVMGHPLLEEEAQPAKTAGPGGRPVQIAFAGNATRAKGFHAFLEVVGAVHARCPGRYDFHAVSYLHPSCSGLDQQLLRTRAANGFPRDQFVSRLAGMDYIFAWHDDAYYANAASGIVYDAINLGVPLLARRAPQLEELQARFGPLGHTFDDVGSVIEHLCAPAEDDARYPGFISNLGAARAAHSIEALAEQFRQGVGGLLQGRH